MPERYFDCIFCCRDNGSAEHMVLAALGGLQTDRTILCEPCNGSFTELDVALADDMRPLNAAVGARHGRTKEPIASVVEDHATGRRYKLSEGRQLRHSEPLVLQDRVGPGGRDIYALTSTQHQADEFLRELKAEGKPLKVGRRERVPLMFAAPPTMHWNFGGPTTFRAVARIALNILAHYFPRQAREPWVEPFKRFVRDGGPFEPWVRYEYAADDTARLPEDSFTFQHRFLIGFDAASQLAYARVSLLGVVELTIMFGHPSVETSETVVHDVDVLATRQPDDVRVRHLPGVALHLPGDPTDDPCPIVSARIARLMAKRIERMWEQDASGLVAAMAEARQCPAYERHDRIVEALRGQEQRLLNLAAFIARDFKRHLTEQFGSEAGAVVDALAPLVQPDGESRTGVTNLTATNAEMLVYVMADHLLPILEVRAVEADELRLLLEGLPGDVMAPSPQTAVVKNGTSTKDCRSTYWCR